MSLINDALKRAGQAQKQNPPPPTAADGLKPADSGGGGSRGILKVIILLLVVCLLGVGGWFGWIALRPASSPGATPKAGPKPTNAALTQAGTQNPKTAAGGSVSAGSNSNLVTKPSDKASTSAPPVINTTVAVEPDAGVSATTSPPSNTSAQVTTTPAPGVEPPAQPPAVVPDKPVVTEKPVALVWPPLKLQAIFYRLNKPSTRINGKTCYVGDQVDGVRVVAIERENVRVELGGESHVLPLKRSE